MAENQQAPYIRDMSAPGAPNYFKTHRPGPLTAAEIRKGVKVTKEQVALVEKTLKELGLLEPKRPKRGGGRRASATVSRSSPSVPLKSK